MFLKSKTYVFNHTFHNFCFNNFPQIFRERFTYFRTNPNKLAAGEARQVFVLTVTVPNKETRGTSTSCRPRDTVPDSLFFKCNCACVLYQSLIINNKLFLIQFIVNITLVSLHRNSRKRCPKARRISCAGSTVTS